MDGYLIALPSSYFVAPFFRLSAMYFPPLLARNWKYLNIPAVMRGWAWWPQGAKASGTVLTRAPEDSAD